MERSKGACEGHQKSRWKKTMYDYLLEPCRFFGFEILSVIFLSINVTLALCFTLRPALDGTLLTEATTWRCCGVFENEVKVVLAVANTLEREERLLIGAGVGVRSSTRMAIWGFAAVDIQFDHRHKLVVDVGGPVWVVQLVLLDIAADSSHLEGRVLVLDGGDERIHAAERLRATRALM